MKEKEKCYITHDELHGADINELYNEGFVKGAQWQNNKSPWYSYPEKLPDDGVEYLACDTHKNIHRLVYTDNKWAQFAMDGMCRVYTDIVVYTEMPQLPDNIDELITNFKKH